MEWWEEKRRQMINKTKSTMYYYLDSNFGKNDCGIVAFSNTFSYYEIEKEIDEIKKSILYSRSTGSDLASMVYYAMKSLPVIDVYSIYDNDYSQVNKDARKKLNAHISHPMIIHKHLPNQSHDHVFFCVQKNSINMDGDIKKVKPKDLLSTCSTFIVMEPLDVELQF